MVLRRTRGRPVYFAAAQNFRIVEDDRFEGEYKVQTQSYVYAASFSQDLKEFFVAWHWHPRRRPEPHLHVNAQNRLAGQLHRKHIPTGRVSFEEVVRFLLTEVKVRENQPDWEDILAESERRFRAFRRWT
jgi:hypothetical protein